MARTVLLTHHASCTCGSGVTFAPVDRTGVFNGSAPGVKVVVLRRRGRRRLPTPRTDWSEASATTSDLTPPPHPSPSPPAPTAPTLGWRSAGRAGDDGGVVDVRQPFNRAGIGRRWRDLLSGEGDVDDLSRRAEHAGDGIGRSPVGKLLEQPAPVL